MATARKLPSGFWRCQVFIHYEIVLDKNGKPVINPKTKKQKQKRIYKSFTCDDPSARGKRKAEAMATEWADNKEIKKDEEVQMTFGDALEKYIQEQSAVLSPSSIRKYKSMQHNCMVPLKEYQLKEINHMFETSEEGGYLAQMHLIWYQKALQIQIGAVERYN